MLFWEKKSPNGHSGLFPWKNISWFYNMVNFPSEVYKIWTNHIIRQIIMKMGGIIFSQLYRILLKRNPL